MREAGRHLLVDISTIAERDSRTGIQRVVRAIVRALPQALPPDVTMRLIAGSATTSYRYLPDDWLTREGAGQLDLQAFPQVAPQAGDIFFGLDLAVRSFPHHTVELARWRRSGVHVHMLLYDLLPLTAPRWFRWRSRRNFRRWLKAVEENADQIIAISDTVAAQMRARQADAAKRIPVHSIRLAGDIGASVPSRGLPAESGRLTAWVRRAPTLMMVGTIEPRKGHRLAVDAFRQLWSSGDETQLLVVGAAGWKTRRLQNAMAALVRSESRFVWLDEVSDELLELLYSEVTALLMATEAEGFGLPLLEALSHGKPVLARDLPVLREVEADGVAFFDSKAEAGQLAARIKEWLPLAQQRPIAPERTCWSDTIADLCRLLQLEGEERGGRRQQLGAA